MATVVATLIGARMCVYNFFPTEFAFGEASGYAPV